LWVDSTGLKVFGEGEWLESKRKIKVRRKRWRKFHILRRASNRMRKGRCNTLNECMFVIVQMNPFERDMHQLSILSAERSSVPG